MSYACYDGYDCGLLLGFAEMVWKLAGRLDGAFRSGLGIFERHSFDSFFLFTGCTTRRTGRFSQHTVLVRDLGGVCKRVDILLSFLVHNEMQCE